MFLTEMMQLPKKYSDNWQALIHQPVLKLCIVQELTGQIIGRVADGRRFNPARKKPFNHCPQQFFLRAEPPEERHFAEASLDGDLTGSSSLQTFARKNPGSGIKKFL